MPFRLVYSLYTIRKHDKWYTHHARNVTSMRFFRAIIVINFVTSMNNDNKNSTGVIDFWMHWQRLFSIPFFFLFRSNTVCVAFLLKIYYLFIKKKEKNTDLFFWYNNKMFYKYYFDFDGGYKRNNNTVSVRW